LEFPGVPSCARWCASRSSMAMADADRHRLLPFAVSWLLTRGILSRTRH